MENAEGKKRQVGPSISCSGADSAEKPSARVKRQRLSSVDNEEVLSPDKHIKRQQDQGECLER